MNKTDKEYDVTGSQLKIIISFDSVITHFSFMIFMIFYILIF